MNRQENTFRTVMTMEAMALGAHVSNIESHQTSAGIPDMNIYLQRQDLWLELKVIRDEKVTMRATQRRWHLDRYEHGGLSWVLVLDPKSEDILVVPGDVAAGLPPRVAAWRAAGTAWNVDTIPKLLLSLAKRRPYERVTEPNRARTTEAAGKAVSPLPESGEDVGGHHWLTDKP